MSSVPYKAHGREIFISAGEASGDLHGANLAKALRILNPSFRVTCLGGPMLGACGAHVLVDSRELAILGVLDIARCWRNVLVAWRKIYHYLKYKRPALVILIDFPDFNFLLGRVAKRVGLRVLYYIAPQVWAWRSNRVRTLQRLADEIVVIFPFEPAFYMKYGISVRYVGHPLVDLMEDALPKKKTAYARYRLGRKGPFVGLCPGSRWNEIKYLLPLLVDSARIIKGRFPNVNFLLPLAAHLERSKIEAMLSSQSAEELPVRVISGDTYGVIQACDIILAASGTITLESAFLGIPMVIVYKIPRLEALIARRLVKVSYIGLPNLIGGREICPELVQDRAVPVLVAREAESLLTSCEKLVEQKRELNRIATRLGQPGVAERVAKIAVEVMMR